MSIIKSRIFALDGSKILAHLCAMELPTFDEIAGRAKANGITLADVCERADIAPSTLRRWRRGQNSATLDLYTRAAEALAALISERKATNA
jgi:Helix-turn-helix